jgi:hypothetical protein
VRTWHPFLRALLNTCTSPWPPARALGHLHKPLATCASPWPPARALGHLHKPMSTCTSPCPPAQAHVHLHKPLASKANKNQDTKKTHSRLAFLHFPTNTLLPLRHIPSSPPRSPSILVSNPTKTNYQHPWGRPPRPSEFQFHRGVDPMARSKTKSPGRADGLQPLSRVPTLEGAASSAQTKTTCVPRLRPTTATHNLSHG